jgi:hypothetical protein
VGGSNRGTIVVCMGLSRRGVCACMFQSGPSCDQSFPPMQHARQHLHVMRCTYSDWLAITTTLIGPPRTSFCVVHCAREGKACYDISWHAASPVTRVRPVGKHLFPCGEATLSASRTCHQLCRKASTRYTRAIGGDDGREGGSSCTVVRVPSAFFRNHQDLRLGRT